MVNILEVGVGNMTGFNHLNYDIPNLKTKNVDGKRFYECGKEKYYPSITTVLSADPKKKKGLADWRKKVGEKEANKISGMAVRKGTAVHSLIEDYINNKEGIFEGVMPNVIESFTSIKHILDLYIGDVYAQEVSMFSDHLKVAGRVDLIGEFDSQLSVVDFKTSRKTKKKSWIHSYFIQACAYSIMWEEMTNIPIKQLVVLITVDGARPQVFMEHRDSWTDSLYRMIDIYYKQQGSTYGS